MRLLHLFDASADWQGLAAVEQLLNRLAQDDHTQWLASIDARHPSSPRFVDRSIARVPMRFDLPVTAAPLLRRFIEKHDIDLIHAWGTDAALAAGSRRESCGLILHRFDPYITDRQARALRTLADTGRFAAACSSATVQRRLVESGVPLEKCVVLRPGVDFRRINAAKKNKTLRARLGLSERDRLILAADPVTANSGHDRMAWSGHLCNYLDPCDRMVICSPSPHRDRIRDLARHIPGPNAVIYPDGAVDYPDLIAVADALVITPPSDAPTTAIAWAMAASCPIVGSAVYAVAEFIAHKHNGYLIKPDRAQAMTIKITAALRNIRDMSKEKETARGQAYEVFSVRRFVEQFVRISENVRCGDAPSHSVTDPATAS